MLGEYMGSEHLNNLERKEDINTEKVIAEQDIETEVSEFQYVTQGTTLGTSKNT